MNILKVVRIIFGIAFLFSMAGCYSNLIDKNHPKTIVLQIEDTNGIPQSGVQYHFAENGIRVCRWANDSLISVKGPTHDVTSDATGVVAVDFKEDHLDVENIMFHGQVVTNFVEIFHRCDGTCFTNQFHLSPKHPGYHQIFQWGFYPWCKDPWREDYTIIIKQ